MPRAVLRVRSWRGVGGGAARARGGRPGSAAAVRRIDADVERRLHAVEQQGDPARRCGCRQLAVEALEVGAAELLHRLPATRRSGSPAAGRQPLGRPALARRASGPASRRRGACARRGRASPSAPAGRASASSSSWRCGLADADRRVRPDAVERGRRRARRRASTARTRSPTPWRSALARHRSSARSFTSTAQTVGAGRPAGQRDRDRAVAAAEVEQRRRRGRRVGVPRSSSSLVPGVDPLRRRTRRGRCRARASMSGSAQARPCRAATRTVGFGSKYWPEPRRASRAVGTPSARRYPCRPWPPTRSGSSATPCSSGSPRTSPTSTARSCSSPRT